MTGQAELFEADSTWFHLFKSMIDSGDVAKMGPTAFMLYAIIKSHTNFHTGTAFPSIETLCRKSGLSKSPVLRALQTLEESGYLTRHKQGRSNVYTLREKVTMTDASGRPAAVATWDYLPATVKAARAELSRFLLTGDDTAPQIVSIERLVIENINIQVGNHNSQTLFHLGDITDPVLREKVVKMLESVDKSKTGVSGDT